MERWTHYELPEIKKYRWSYGLARKAAFHALELLDQLLGDLPTQETDPDKAVHSTVEHISYYSDRIVEITMRYEGNPWKDGLYKEHYKKWATNELTMVVALAIVFAKCVCRKNNRDCDEYLFRLDKYIKSQGG